jgi:hypothetical protein
MSGIVGKEIKIRVLGQLPGSVSVGIQLSACTSGGNWREELARGLFGQNLFQSALSKISPGCQLYYDARKLCVKFEQKNITLLDLNEIDLKYQIAQDIIEKIMDEAVRSEQLQKALAQEKAST